MKKLFPAAVLAVLAVCSCAEAENVGDVIGEVYSTDILATVDGVPIPSYNIGGRTAIILEDLRSYGFGVEWNPDDRTLRVLTDYMPEAPQTPEVRRGSVGETVGNVLYTDITAYVNGIKINSYNIGGYTCACIEDLGELTDEYNREFGYSDYNFNYEWNPDERTVALNCFRFPELDAEAILADHSSLICNKEYGLFTEGSNSEALYYGAKNEPKSGVIAGMIGDGNGNSLLNEPAVFNHEFGCYSNYVEFGSRQTRLYKPMDEEMRDKTCMLCVPWNISDITQVYDSGDYIRELLDNIASYNKPTVIRFAAEMNVNNLGDSPAAYVKAFRFAADIIHREYPDFAVMWSPNDMGALNRPMSLYYPGDEYVDWIGVSSFLKRDFPGKTDTTRNEAIYFTLGDFAWTANSLRYVTRFMEENNIQKPLAVSEGAVAASVPYDTESLDAWAEPRLREMYWYTPMRYPQVKLITYFNHTTPGEGCGYDMSDKPNYAAIMDEALNNGQYLLEYPAEPEFTFVEAKGHTVAGSALNLYSYSYIPEELTVSVAYSLDGGEESVFTDIPFKYSLDISALAEGEHTLTVTVRGERTADEYAYRLIKSAGSVTVE